MNAWNNMTFFVEDFSYMPALLTQPGGLPPNTAVEEIDGGLLVPLINAVENRQAYLINCYGLLNRSEEQPFAEITDLSERYKRLAETMDVNALGDAVDDVLIYGETATDLWMFWMHRSGRCDVTRLAKVEEPEVAPTLEEFVAAHLTFMRGIYINGWRYNDESENPIIHRIPSELGTVSWI